MPFKAGGFYFPTSTGTFQLPTDFEVQGGLFFGGNFVGEDVVVSLSHPCIFFGMAWREVGGAIDAQSVSNSVNAGVNVKPSPIMCIDTTGTVMKYRANLVSFDSDGITLNAVVAAPGSGYLVHYLLWGEFDGANGIAANVGPITVPYRPLTGIGFNYRTAGAVRDGAVDGESTTMWVGGANWPDIEAGGNERSWATAGFARLQTVGFNGFTQVLANTLPGPQFQSPINFMTGDGILTIDEERLYMWRNALGEIDILASGGPHRYFGQWWTGEGYHDFIGVNPVLGGGGGFTAGGAVEDIEAAWFAGIVGGNEGGLDATNRMTLGVCTKDTEGNGYQGCVAVTRDGSTGYQSQETCVVDGLDGTNALAASAVLSGKNIITTTEIAGAAGGDGPVAFTYEDELPHQQFFRVVHR